MEQRAGFPYAEVHFGKTGEVIERASFDDMLDTIAHDGTLELLVLCHGWNNNIAEARQLYEQLAEQVRDVQTTGAPRNLGQRNFAIVGALWPSKRWAERALSSGAAASVGGDAEEEDVVALLNDLAGVFDAHDADERLSRARALVPDLVDDPAARDRFVELVRGLAPAGVGEDADDFAEEYRELSGQRVLDELRAPIRLSTTEQQGGGAGLREHRKADQGLSPTGIRAAAERFLNLTTYYQMKERAGVVGVAGLNPALREVRARRADTRLHLVGHSFGGRLVTACTVGRRGEPALSPDTVSLLQAAFSHYGFAHDYEDGKDGFFRRLVTAGMVRGPVLITHSVCDIAVGYAYPLASRLARQVAAGLGDPSDRYGGIGRNGAQKTPEAHACEMQDPGAHYPFTAQRLLNVNADAVIEDHSDIRKPQVAYAILAAIASAP